MEKSRVGRRGSRLTGGLVAVVLLTCLVQFPAPFAHAATSLSFGMRTDYPSFGNSLVSLAGDLNGDSFPDLVVLGDGAGSNPNYASVYINDGSGGFGPRTDYGTVVRSPNFSGALVDLNGDAQLDLVTANRLAQTISVLLGDGQGGFGSAVEYRPFSGAPPFGLAVGDVNGDSFVDVVTTDLEDPGTIDVQLGNGTGGFSFAFRRFFTGSDPYTVALGDINGDGLLDAVTANNASNDVSVLLGDGTGAFGPHTDYPAGSSPASVALTDLNRDGTLDVAVTNAGSASVSVLLADGTGGFGAKTDFAVGVAPDGLATADFNGDGIVDLATANQVTNNVSVLLGTGTGAFLRKVDFAVPSPRGVTAADFDKDGWVDLAVADGWQSGSPDKLSVLRNTSGIPSPPSPPAIIRNATAGDRSATLSWLAPVSDGASPIIGYVVTAYVGYAPVTWRAFNSTLTTRTVNGLTNGTEYRFRVRAYNAIGFSDYSKVTNPVTPNAQPI